MTTQSPQPQDDGQQPHNWDTYMSALNNRLSEQKDKNPPQPDKAALNNFMDFVASPFIDPQFAPIRNLIPPPADNPDYNRPISDDFTNSVDVYQEVRELLPSNKIEPNVILPVKEVFRAWQQKLAQGIESEMRAQGQTIDDDKLTEIADLSRNLATKGITTLQERTLGDNLEAAWVPVRPIVPQEDLLDNDNISNIVYAGIYDANLKQATELKLLRSTNVDGSNNDEIANSERQLLLSSAPMLTPHMQIRDERKRTELLEEKANIARYADPDVAKEEIDLAKAKIALLNTEIESAWPTEERLRKESARSELAFVRKELQEFSDNPEVLKERTDQTLSTLSWQQARQQQGEQVDAADVLRLTGRHAFLQKLQEPDFLQKTIADYDSKLGAIAAEFAQQPDPMSISTNRGTIGTLNQHIQKITEYKDETQRNHAMSEIDFAVSVIDDRLGLPHKISRELPALREQQKQAEQQNDFNRYAGVTSKLETFEEVTARIEAEKAEADPALLEKHAIDIATKAGRHKHLMTSVGTIMDSGYITMLSDAGMDKSTAKWGAELLVDAIRETPQFAPYAGFPLEGLRPAEDLMPANRLGEIYSASRNLPWQEAQPSPALPKNAGQFVNVDDVLLEATKVLSEPQGDKEEDAKRLALGVFLNRNSFAVRRVVDRWVQDGNIPAFRDERIDPASEMIVGYHVEAKNVLRAVEAVFSEGVTSNKITLNPEYLKNDQQEAVIGSASYAFKPESVELMQDSMATGVRRISARKAAKLEQSDTLVPVTPKYKKGEEKLFMVRQTTETTADNMPEPASEILPPVNDNQQGTITLKVNANSLLQSGGTVRIDVSQGKEGPEVQVDVLTRDDVLAYRKRKAEEAPKPTPKINFGM